VGLAGSSSILDNDDVTFAMGENYDSVNDAESNTMIGDDDTEARVNGNVNVNTSFTRRHSAPTTSHSHSSSHHHTLGPMVGHMVDNAINQTGGVGLHSPRAKLLQGIIDRPDWIQSRWTDGECVFGELVARCGLQSFENRSAGSSAAAAAAAAGRGSGGSAGGGGGGGSESESGNGGAGTVASSSPPETVVGSRLHKTTNLSAHLITVPAIPPNTTKERVALAGMGVETVEEIARGILRLSETQGQSFSVQSSFGIAPRR